MIYFFITLFYDCFFQFFCFLKFWWSDIGPHLVQVPPHSWFTFGKIFSYQLNCESWPWLEVSFLYFADPCWFEWYELIFMYIFHQRSVICHVLCTVDWSRLFHFTSFHCCDCFPRTVTICLFYGPVFQLGFISVLYDVHYADVENFLESRVAYFSNGYQCNLC